MNAIVQTEQPRRSLVDSMAARYDMEPAAFVSAIKATVIKGQVSNEQFAAFLMVAKEYDLNPLLKEIYAFPSNGGIQPIVSIDGWMKLINSHPQFDGMEFNDMPDADGKLAAVECRMYRKDRGRPICVIEYMAECYRQTPTWKQWPSRMLRHKAAIQAARYAFGFSEIMEPDEFERMRDVTPREPVPISERLAAAREETEEAREGFDQSFVTRETSALTGEPESGQDEQISQSPDAPSSASDDSGGEAKSSPAATDTADVADPAGADDMGDSQAPAEPASTVNAAIYELMRECITNLIRTAVNTSQTKDAAERAAKVKADGQAWFAELPNHHAFVKRCVETCERLAADPSNEDTAREYLKNKLPEVEA